VAERALGEKAEIHAQLQVALTAVRIALWRWDPKRDIDIASWGMEKLFGLCPGERWQSTQREFQLNSREPIAGWPLWERAWFALTPGAPEMLRQAIERAAAGKFVRCDDPLRRPSGGVSSSTSRRVPSGTSSPG
jgi:hypothetical protein